MEIDLEHAPFSVVGRWEDEGGKQVQQLLQWEYQPPIWHNNIIHTLDKIGMEGEWFNI